MALIALRMRVFVRLLSVPPVAAAASDLDVTWVSYTPAYRSAALTGTGLGFVRWS